MSINGIGNSAASFAQFVKITQAARERNSMMNPANGANSISKPAAPQPAPVQPAAAQSVDIASFKKALNVYSGKLVTPAQAVQQAASETVGKAMGGKFDAYA